MKRSSHNLEATAERQCLRQHAVRVSRCAISNGSPYRQIRASPESVRTTLVSETVSARAGGQREASARGPLSDSRKVGRPGARANVVVCAEADTCTTAWTSRPAVLRCRSAPSVAGSHPRDRDTGTWSIGTVATGRLSARLPPQTSLTIRMSVRPALVPRHHSPEMTSCPRAIQCKSLASSRPAGYDAPRDAKRTSQTNALLESAGAPGHARSVRGSAPHDCARVSRERPAAADAALPSAVAHSRLQPLKAAVEGGSSASGAPLEVWSNSSPTVTAR